jgi:hypothetical protein
MAIIPRADIQDPNVEVPETPETPETPAQNFASTDDVASLKQQLSDLKEIIGEGFRRPEAPQQATPVEREPEILDVDDNDLEASLRDATPGMAKKVRLAVKAEIARELRSIKQELRQVKEFGVNALGELGERVAKTDMPLLAHPKLGKQIRSEIEQMAKMQPELKSNPRVLKAVHDRIRGENYEMLLQEDREAAVRAAALKAQGSSDPTQLSGRNQPTTPATPTPQELLGINWSTEDADSMAAKLGHGNWEGYAKVILAQRESANEVKH